MKKTYYLFHPGRLSRRDHTLKFTPVDAQGQEGRARYLPVEGIKALFVFGSLDANSALYNFLGKQRIPLHFFDHYEHYTGSFMPREYLQAGKMQTAQCAHYLQPQKRLLLARRLVQGAAQNMDRVLRYYLGRGRPLQPQLEQIQTHTASLPQAADIPTLMGTEGNIRQCYYSAFDHIIGPYRMGPRKKQPPSNEVNALISFGNMLCYTLCLDQIYHTQLNPTISFLHEPGARRFSLALDLAEIFKPLLVDRTIFKLLNKGMMPDASFDRLPEACLLSEKGRKIFVQQWEDRLQQSIHHRSLGRKVSYRQLVRLECYKLAKHCLDIEPYQPFVAWW